MTEFTETKKLPRTAVDDLIVRTRQTYDSDKNQALSRDELATVIDLDMFQNDTAVARLLLEAYPTARIAPECKSGDGNSKEDCCSNEITYSDLNSISEIAKSTDKDRQLTMLNKYAEKLEMDKSLLVPPLAGIGFAAIPYLLSAPIYPALAIGALGAGLTYLRYAPIFRDEKIMDKRNWEKIVGSFE